MEESAPTVAVLNLCLFRFSMNLWQLQCEVEVTLKTMHRRIERFARALDAPSPGLLGSFNIDKVCFSAGKKVR
jgi:hypothetical protein